MYLKVIKLNAIDSTNSYLKELSSNSALQDPIVVVAHTQEKGRGQQGASWQSETGKSLTFSLFKRFSALSVSSQASLNFAVSLGVFEALEHMEVPDIAIKWPNDILSHNKKLAGILIENQVQGSKIVSSVIGMGLNVNEHRFRDLPHATSMKLSAGREFDLDKVLEIVANSIIEQLNSVERVSKETLMNAYESHLFRKDMLSVFETPQGERKNGKILGVTTGGQLRVVHEDDKIREYGMKEIKLLY